MANATHLSRRERQIMDIVYELKEASAKQVLARLPDPPGYSAVRAMLARLEAKGQLQHREQDLKYIYFPAHDHDDARRSAISRLVKTFFDGSVAQAMNAMIDVSGDGVSDRELEELERLIEKVRNRQDIDRS